jgi:hypothetical protein
MIWTDRKRTKPCTSLLTVPNMRSTSLPGMPTSSARSWAGISRPHGRRQGGGRVRQPRMPGVGVDAKAIRLWAIDNGLQVNTRGRIQADIVEKYQAAH